MRISRPRWRWTKGEGVINVEALDEKGNYRNFLNLQTAVVSPKGERQTVRLEQTGPGHYEAKFPTKEVGAYLMNLMDMKDGQLRGSQVVGASVNYSPEFNAPEPNLNLLRRLAESGGGKVLDRWMPSDGQSVPARPAKNFSAARPVGMAVKAGGDFVCAGRGRAAAFNWIARNGCGRRGFAAVVVFLEGPSADGGSRRIVGGIAGASRRGSLQTAGPGRGTARGSVQTRETDFAAGSGGMAPREEVRATSVVGAGKKAGTNRKNRQAQPAVCSRPNGGQKKE